MTLFVVALGTFMIGIASLMAYPGDVFTTASQVKGLTISPGTEIPVGTYSVASRTGAALYSFPIMVPPGRQGMQPALSLNYSSQNPIRGGLAAGWSMNVASIRVDTSMGRLGGTHYSSTLAGGQRLVEVDEPGAAEEIQSYRAENDSSYTRYEKIPTGTPGESYWRALGSDGMTYFFGDERASRDHAGDNGLEARWFLTRVTDRLGNTIVYHYQPVWGRALNGRLEDLKVDIALTEITYSRNDAAGISDHARIVFNYSESLDTCPNSNIPIGSQFDYRTGIRIYESARRLNSIMVQVRPGPDDSWVDRREISIRYDEAALRCDQPHAPLRLISQIQERAWNIENELVATPALTFNYSRLSHDFTEEKPALAISGQSLRTVGRGKRRLNDTKAGGWPTIDGMLLDIDGDGRQDWLKSQESENDYYCKFTWRNESSLLPALPWSNTATDESNFGFRNLSNDIHRLESCSLAYQLSRRWNKPLSSATSCGGPGSNYTSYRFMDMDGDGDQDLVTALDFKRGRYTPADDAALQDADRYGAAPVCPSQSACRAENGDPIPCKTDFLHGVFAVPFMALIGDAGVPTDDDGGIGSTPKCKNNMCTPGLCVHNPDGDPSDPCGCGTCLFPDANANEWSPPEGAGSGGTSFGGNGWLGNSFPDGPIGKETTGAGLGGNPWCAQEPEMDCRLGTGASYYVWRIYWNGERPAEGDIEIQGCTVTLSSGLKITVPCSVFEGVVDQPVASDFQSSSDLYDVFNVTEAPDLVLSPLPLETDRPTSSLGAGDLAASSSWHGFIDIDGDGFIDGVWQDPSTPAGAGVTGTGYPGPGPTGRFLVFRGDGRGRFQPDVNGEPFRWATPSLGDAQRARVNLRRSHNKYPLQYHNNQLLDKEIHRFTETVVTLQDINGDGLPDYVESREVGNFGKALRVFYNNGVGFESGVAGDNIGTILSDDLPTLSREETVVLTVERNLQMKNGWSQSVRRLLDFDQDGLPDVFAIKPPMIGQKDPWEYPTEEFSLYNFDGLPQSVISEFPQLALGDFRQSTVTAYMNVGDRLVKVRTSPGLDGIRDAMARINISSKARWVVKTDVLDFDSDGLIDVYNNDVHADSQCLPTLGSDQGNPLFDKAGSQYSLVLCGISGTVRGDSQAQNGMRLLTSIDSGQGALVTLSYAPVTNKDVVTDDPKQGKRTPWRLWVVNSISVDPGNGPASHTDYHFTNPVLNKDNHGRYGFRGFEEATILSPITSTGARGKTTELYDYTIDYSGRMVESRKQNELSEFEHIESTKWQKISLFDGAVTTYHQKEAATYFCNSSSDGSSDDCKTNAPLTREINYWTPILGWKPRSHSIGDLALDPDENVLAPEIDTEEPKEPGAPGFGGFAGLAVDPGDSMVATEYGTSVTEAPEESTLGRFSELEVDPGGRVVATDVPGADSPTTPPDIERHPMCSEGENSNPVITPDSTVRAVAVALCSTRLTNHRSTVAPDDRATFFGYKLIYSKDLYHLLRTENRKFAVTQAANSSDDWGDLQAISKDETIYDDSLLGLPVALHSWREEEIIATTKMVYDAATGNLTSMQKPEQVSEGSIAQSTLEYDDQYRLFVTRGENELAQSISSETDIGTGQVLRTTGPMQPGIGMPETRTSYDGFGRALDHFRSIDNENGGYDLGLYSSMRYFDSEIPVRTRETQKIAYNNTSAIITDRFYDGVDRLIATKVHTFSGLAETTYQYDAAGNAVSMTIPNPQTAVTEPALFRYSHDTMGRVIRYQPPVGAVVELQYDGLVTRKTELPEDSSSAKPVTSELDEFGRIQKITERMANGDDAVTIYSYDGNDNIRQVENADNLITTFEYDYAGQRTAISRGERSWRFRYDLNGNLLATTSPHPIGTDENSYTTTFQYDDLDRMILSTPAFRGLTPEAISRYRLGPVEYQYDLATSASSVGRLSRVISPLRNPSQPFTIEYHYSAEGWTTTERRSFEIDPFGSGPVADTREVRIQYNALGLPRRIVHADGIDNPTTFSTDYDERGFPRQVSLISLTDDTPPVEQESTLASVQRSLAGLPVHRNSANQQHNWTYDPLGRVVDHRVNIASNLISGESITYNDVGNVASVLNHGTGVRLNYTYDTQHQLRTAISENPDIYLANFEYSGAGRVLRTQIESAIAGGGVSPRHVVHDYSGQPGDIIAYDAQAVRKLLPDDGGAVPVATYDYDLSGNVTEKQHGATHLTFIFDGYDDLREASTIIDGDPDSLQQEVYFYDHGGQRMLAYSKPDGSGTGTVRFWLGDTEIRYDSDGSQQKSIVRANLNGQPVARFTDQAHDTPEFLYQGVLQHLLAVLNNDGNVRAKFGYGPFGEILDETGPDSDSYSRRFNNKESDRLTSLSYYGYRYYDSLSMNWTQADPLYRFAPDMALDEPRRMNLYAFSLNNPLRYIDPDGYDARDDAIKKGVKNANSPHYRPNVDYRDMRNHGQQDVRDGEFSAWTNSAGRVYVDHRVIDMPFNLDVALYHETLHVDQFDSTGEPKTISQMGDYEIKAYQKSAAYVRGLKWDKKYHMTPKQFERAKKKGAAFFSKMTKVARKVKKCGQTKSTKCDKARNKMSIPHTDAAMRKLYEDEPNKKKKDKDEKKKPKDSDADITIQN